MNYEDYKTKAKLILDDPSTYQQLINNPLDRFVREYNSILKENLPGNLIKRMKTISPSLGYFYGLPKIHKEGFPLYTL